MTMTETDDDRLFVRAGAVLRQSGGDETVLNAAHVRRLRGGIHAAQRRRVVWHRRRAVGLRTFAGAALAAAMLLATGIVPGVHGPGHAPSAPGDEVTFSLSAGDAHRVALVGEFNGWNPASTPMTRNTDGHWAVRLRIPPGRHTYAFVVNDSTWVADPIAARAPEHWFGDPRSVLVVADGR
jgi:hypothetical protein